MTIISTTHLERELPVGFSNENGALDDAVAQATAFVNTWAKRYYPFDDYQESPLAILAPQDIGRECIEIAKAHYFLRVAQVNRNGDEIAFWYDILEQKRDLLKNITVEPTWESQTISLDSNNAMVIGARNTVTGAYHEVIPFRANVISAAGNRWTSTRDWEITLGGRFDDDEPDAWYFYANQDGVEGTLHYLRTYRNDSADNRRYMRTR